jgi:hypothetical protein
MPSDTKNTANFDPDENPVTPEICCRLFLNAAQIVDEAYSYDENYDRSASFDKSDLYISLGYSSLSDGSLAADALASGLVVLTGDVTIDE